MSEINMSKTLDQLFAEARGEARLAALKDALSCQPTTAENPNESLYQRGRFDGIIEFGEVIAKLKGKG